ncbi:hypothetical protein AK812_SmicGene18815 [Symbiodinium microadriaticum]|uniref:Uncharacterized protein n=1 Tax=Symbiodinium microadriaticum TaxID=2951 RepID=A0A1Q9DU71_SYMMI|nr:hypothetical protein AK812_SmicGene18815 [Symbiodinium microadriaticum]
MISFNQFIHLPGTPLTVAMVKRAVDPSGFVRPQHVHRQEVIDPHPSSFVTLLAMEADVSWLVSRADVMRVIVSTTSSMGKFLEFLLRKSSFIDGFLGDYRSCPYTLKGIDQDIIIILLHALVYP